MIKNSYLVCTGHFTTKGYQKLRWAVDFKDPEVKRQLKEVFMNGKYEGELIYNGITYKWSLKSFEILNTGLPGTSVPISFDMLTEKGREVIIDKMIGDFWLASFNICGDDLLISEKVLADKYNCICELQKALNYNPDYLNDIIPYVSNELKYDYRFMRDVLKIFDKCVNTDQVRINNAIEILKYDRSFINYLDAEFVNNPNFIKQLAEAGLVIS